MLKYVFMLLFIAAPAAAEVRTAEPPPVWLKSVVCRLASREAAPSANIRTLKDAIIDTLSNKQGDNTLDVSISGGRTLGVSVQHVYVGMPRQRFNVTMLLDGKTHLRMNHMDLDIYLETTIEGQIYILHCFPDVSEEPVPMLSK